MEFIVVINVNKIIVKSLVMKQFMKLVIKPYYNQFSFKLVRPYYNQFSFILVKLVRHKRLIKELIMLCLNLISFILEFKLLIKLELKLELKLHYNLEFKLVIKQFKIREIIRLCYNQSSFERVHKFIMVKIGIKLIKELIRYNFIDLQVNNLEFVKIMKLKVTNKKIHYHLLCLI